MAVVYPFRAYRPKSELAPKVASVPYDVVSTEEAKTLASDNPYSFLHVTRPEIDLPNVVDEHSREVYEAGGATLRRFIQDGILQRDETPSYYLYRLTMGDHVQTGFVLCASVADYEKNIVRKHEFTRPDKENDRVEHMEALGAQSGKVFLCHPDSRALATLAEDATKATPAVDITADDKIRHQLWVVDADTQVTAITQAFEQIPVLYIADGHHRSAAAMRVAQAHRKGDTIDPTSPYEKFLAVSFPASEMNVLPYNRVVHDLNGQSDADFFAKLERKFDVLPQKTQPLKPRHFNMCIGGKWTTLVAREGTYNPSDPVDRLDVSILQHNVLAPLLGIDDPRRSTRISFVGGIRGDEELERRVREGAAVAFALYPTSMEDLFAIADAGEAMPPKSTWFEPKLRDGLVVHRFE